MSSSGDMEKRGQEQEVSKQGMRTYLRILADCRAKGIKVGCKPARVARGFKRQASNGGGTRDATEARIAELMAALSRKG